jgi:polyisoprenoid-binding protein YceI
MKRVFVFVITALMATAALTAAETFVVDKYHSEATFQIRHLITRVSGRFNEVSGSINVDRSNPTVSSVEFTIKTASIDTGVAPRDNDLRGANFFEVDKYPEITFKSTSIKPSGKKDVYDVTGAFTMHGITKTITIPVEFLGFAKDPQGKERAGFVAHTSLNRQDYGIKWNKALDNGGALLGDDVDITVNVDAAKSVAAVKDEVKKEKTR